MEGPYAPVTALQGQLEVAMDKGSDFWRLSYYDPPFIHDSAHVYGIRTAADVVAETTFHLSTSNQFDQVGDEDRTDLQWCVCPQVGGPGGSDKYQSHCRSIFRVHP
jgi:regulation of enolase protein 1 (concanavalin A-like superfamily)